MAHIDLGNLLVAEGFISEQDKQTIENVSGQTSAIFAKGVVALGIMDEVRLVDYISQKTNFEAVNRSDFENQDFNAVQAVDFPILQKLEVIPIKLEDKTLTVAMADPTDRGVVRELEFFSQLKVKAKVAPLSEIRGALAQIIPDYQSTSSPLELFVAHFFANRVQPHSTPEDFQSTNFARQDEGLEEDLDAFESQENFGEPLPGIEDIDTSALGDPDELEGTDLADEFSSDLEQSVADDSQSSAEEPSAKLDPFEAAADENTESLDSWDLTTAEDDYDVSMDGLFSDQEEGTEVVSETAGASESSGTSDDDGDLMPAFGIDSESLESDEGEASELTQSDDDQSLAKSAAEESDYTEDSSGEPGELDDFMSAMEMGAQDEDDPNLKPGEFFDFNDELEEGSAENEGLPTSDSETEIESSPDSLKAESDFGAESHEGSGDPAPEPFAQAGTAPEELTSDNELDDGTIDQAASGLDATEGESLDEISSENEPDNFEASLDEATTAKAPTNETKDPAQDSIDPVTGEAAAKETASDETAVEDQSADQGETELEAQAECTEQTSDMKTSAETNIDSLAAEGAVVDDTPSDVVTEKSATSDPVQPSETPAVEDSIIEDEDFATESLAADDSVIEDSALDDQMLEDPMLEDPIVEDPTLEGAATDDSELHIEESDQSLDSLIAQVNGEDSSTNEMATIEETHDVEGGTFPQNESELAYDEMSSTNLTAEGLEKVANDLQFDTTDIQIDDSEFDNIDFDSDLEGMSDAINEALNKGSEVEAGLVASGDLELTENDFVEDDLDLDMDSQDAQELFNKQNAESNDIAAAIASFSEKDEAQDAPPEQGTVHSAHVEAETDEPEASIDGSLPETTNELPAINEDLNAVDATIEDPGESEGFALDEDLGAAAVGELATLPAEFDIPVAGEQNTVQDPLDQDDLEEDLEARSDELMGQLNYGLVKLSFAKTLESASETVVEILKVAGLKDATLLPVSNPSAPIKSWGDALPLGADDLEMTEGKDTWVDQGEYTLVSTGNNKKNMILITRSEFTKDLAENQKEVLLKVVHLLDQRVQAFEEDLSSAS